MEVIFFRDHPKTPDTAMLIGKLNNNTWRSYPKQKFYNWRNKCKSGTCGASIQFVRVRAPQMQLSKVKKIWLDCGGKEVIFFRDHPEKPDTHMQISDIFGHDWRDYERNRFFGWMRKPAQAAQAVFVAIGDKTVSLEQVIANYLEFGQLCQMTDGLLHPTKGSKNKIMLDALQRTSNNHWQNLIPASSKVQQVVREAYRGGIQCAQKGWSGQAWKYDITSCYPSIAASDCLFPLGQPEFATVKELDDDLLNKPAYYFCKVETEHPLFRRSSGAAWYTNVDIRMALDLELSIHLADIPDNAVLFPGCAPGKEIFGEYVQKLFKLKKEGVAGCKLLLNKLFGLLGKKSYREFGRGGDRSLSQHPMTPGECLKLIPDDHGSHLVKLTKNDQFFAYPNLCALAPFITAHARERLIGLFQDHDIIANVKQAHTDGFILDKKIEWNNAPSGKELGGIKLEYEGYVTVHHVNRVRDSNDHKV